jgi:hypothetical protein
MAEADADGTGMARRPVTLATLPAWRPSLTSRAERGLCRATTCLVGKPPNGRCGSLDSIRSLDP